jgi:uncharacterized protein
MPDANVLRISVADLRLPGATRDVDLAAPVADLHGDAVALPPGEPVHVQLHLERVSEGIVARGEIEATWEGPCSRCLTSVGGRAHVHVDELFEPNPIEGETYALEHDVIDLALMVRDALVLEFPHTPLCGPECRGLCPNCGTDRNAGSCDCTTEEVDERWAALRSLDIQ